jgi:hypothetical protein
MKVNKWTIIVAAIFLHYRVGNNNNTNEVDQEKTRVASNHSIIN